MQLKQKSRIAIINNICSQIHLNFTYYSNMRSVFSWDVKVHLLDLVCIMYLTFSSQGRKNILKSCCPVGQYIFSCPHSNITCSNLCMHCSCLISYIIYQVLALMSDRLYLVTCKLCFAQKKLRYSGMDCFFLYSIGTQNAVISCRCFYCKLFLCGFDTVSCEILFNPIM